MIIDVHTHITPRMPQSLFDALNRKAFSATTLLRTMDKEGIDKSVVLPLSNPENRDMYMVAGSLETIRECAKYPDRLIPFYNLDPRGMLCDPKADLGALMRVFRDAGCQGIGEICANMPITHTLYQNLFHHAGEEKMPMLFHFTGRTYGAYGVRDSVHLPGLEKMLKQFPNSIFIGHGPAFWAEMSWDVERLTRESYPKTPITKEGRIWQLLDQYPNLYCDVSAGSGYNALVRTPEKGFEFLKKYSKQILFGTDRFSPGLPPPPIIALISDALKNKHITKKDYDNITHLNFNKITRR
ncbi:MAG: amidohydrolase family protein [Lentisphaerae bacterium]|nr:amidohydrolase family protein [Lentisphaerota bacterium]